MTNSCQQIEKLVETVQYFINWLNRLDRRNIYSLIVASNGLGYPIVPAEEEGCVHKDVKKRC